MKFDRILIIFKEKISKVFQKVFVASESDPKMARKKQLRLGFVVLVLFLVACYFVQDTGNNISKYKQLSNKKAATPNLITKTDGISALTSGTENEMLWTEKESKALEALKQTEEENTKKQLEKIETLATEKISKEEMAEIIVNLKAQMEQDYNKKLEQALSSFKPQTQEVKDEHHLISKSFIKKKKISKLGEYIPANTYVSAKLIAGVDAGVGMIAEANPRAVLMRITGEAISAGLGAEFLKTNKLIGCQLSAKAVGDISSEKVYLDGVLMTCALDHTTFIEIPVKAWITAGGKSGIRGEIVSREGDMVLKSFLAGLASGFGGGVSQVSQSPLSLSSAGLVSTSKPSAKSILETGLGSGIGQSSDRLADFFIKRAEQYQPVISINEGVDVTVVFQEGFSLKMEKGDEK